MKTPLGGETVSRMEIIMLMQLNKHTPYAIHLNLSHCFAGKAPGVRLASGNCLHCLQDGAFRCIHARVRTELQFREDNEWTRSEFSRQCDVGFDK